jgi:hypothetical protein
MYDALKKKIRQSFACHSERIAEVFQSWGMLIPCRERVQQILARPFKIDFVHDTFFIGRSHNILAGL